MDKNPNIVIWPFPFVFSVNVHRGRMESQGICPLNLLLILSVLFSVGLSNVPRVEYDWGAQPRLVCMPLPADTDPSCFPPDGVTHDPSINGHNNGHSSSHSNGHGKGYFVGGLPNSPTDSSNRRGVSDEAKATILHLRESLVHQKETILDQREIIRELTAKLALCEGFGRGVSGYHDEGHHGSHQPSHHYDSEHHSDPLYPLSGYHNDPQRGKLLEKFSPEQAGKTLQALKERLENLQVRNSSSTYSSSLKDLLQRKISALEEQLHRHYVSHHDYDNHESQPGRGHHDSHHDDQHGDHHDNHDNIHPNGHQPSHHYGHHYDHLMTNGNDNNDHHHDPHSNHNDDHQDDRQDSQHNGQHDDHHSETHDSSHHSKSDHGQQHYSPLQSTPSRTRGTFNKLDSILSHLYHMSPETGNQKKTKNPDGFQIGFPMHTNYMYGRIKRTLLNEIFALTVCLWLKGGLGPGIGTPFSYAVPGQANELVLIEWANSPMELLVNDKAVTLPLSLQDRKWHHVCVAWSTRDGVWEAYQNGVKRGSGENLSPWHSIKPGGVFILGQEQDTLGGRFDATQSFVGEMSDLQVWSRVLNSQEISNQASCSSHLNGDVIAWSESIMELHGGVTKYPFDPCQ